MAVTAVKCFKVIAHCAPTSHHWFQFIVPGEYSGVIYCIQLAFLLVSIKRAQSSRIIPGPSTYVLVLRAGGTPRERPCPLPIQAPTMREKRRDAREYAQPGFRRREEVRQGESMARAVRRQSGGQWGTSERGEVHREGAASKGCGRGCRCTQLSAFSSVTEPGTGCERTNCASSWFGNTADDATNAGVISALGEGSASVCVGTNGRDAGRAPCWKSVASRRGR